MTNPMYQEPSSMLSMPVKRTATAVAVLLAALAMTACGSSQAPSATESAVPSPAVAQVQDATPEPSASESEAAPVPTAVVYLGETQVVHVNGQAIAHVQVQSYDPTDSGVEIKVESLAEPFVLDPGAFTLLDAFGTEIVGVASNPKWDVDLAANDQTMGQVRFIGATAPVSITYSPNGGDDPLIWSFN